MELNKIEELPDYMDPRDIKSKFIEVINYHNLNARENKIEIGEALTQLSERQWHTYELIDSELRMLIEEWITKNIDVYSCESINSIAGIILSLGLSNSYSILKDFLKKDLDTDYYKLIQEIVKEYGDDISDPYASLRNLT